MKSRWHRQVCSLTVLGAVAAVLFVFAAPALAHDSAAAARSSRAPTKLVAPAHRILTAPHATTRLGNPPTVSGTALDYAGNPIANTYVDLYWTSTSQYAGSDQTGADGSFSIVPFRAPSDSDTSLADLGVEYDNGDYLVFFNQPTGAAATLRPGEITVNVANLLNPAQSIEAMLFGNAANGGNADCLIAGASSQSLAVPGTVGYACLYLSNAQGIEWGTSTPIDVSAGALSSATIDADAADAKSITTLGWASGAPGTNAIVGLANWPAGEMARLTGHSEFTYRGSATMGTWTSTGTTGIRTVKVPTTATPGYAYLIDAARQVALPDFSDFDVFDYYQVCTLKPSASAIRRGHTITLSGIVPTKGHTPSTVGLKKLVYVYARTVAIAKQPATWNPAAGHRISGWTLVASMYSNGNGVYKTKLLKPLKTTYYVAYYKGDSWYWPAYTSITRVTVKK